MKKNKVLILGHPHSSSSLLKSLFAKSENAVERIKETQYISNSLLVKDKFIVGKTPLYTPKLNLDSLIEHHLVLIGRNPCYALQSLTERFRGSYVPDDHKIFFTIEYWNWFLEQYINWKGPKILYKEIFDQNKLKKLFDDVGLIYPEDVYGDYERRISDIEIPKEQPKRTDHLNFRQWQLNQKITYKDENRAIPSEKIYEKIKNLENFKKIFE
jgi:hypothetical protein